MLPDNPQALAAPRRTKYTWKRLIIFSVTVFGLAFSTLLVGLYYTAGLLNPDKENPLRQVATALTNPGVVAFANKSRLNILCLGVDYNHDARDQRHTKWARSDTIFVVSVEKEAKSLSILSIPRDMWVNIPGHGPDKINAAFSLKETGDLDLTTRTVEQFLGIAVDHTVVIKEYAAQRLVDALGGVAIDVPKDMDYDDNWGHLHIHLKKGPQRLNGTQAVGFVRFRHDEEGDRGRIRRQQQFMDAMLKEVRKPQNFTPSKLRAIVRAVKDNIQTSLSFGELIDLANVYKSFNRKLLRSAKIDGDDVEYGGAACIEANEADKKRLVDSLLKGMPLQEARDLKLVIVDASGIAGAAQRVADHYRNQGYQGCSVRPPAHANDTRYNLSHISTQHRGDDFATSRNLLKADYIDINFTTDDDATNSDYAIVLGRDWSTRARPAGL